MERSEPATTGASAQAVRHGSASERSPTASTSISRGLLRMGMACYAGALRLVARRGDTKPALPDKVTILLTGTFYSDNWIRTHLLPLGLAEGSAEVLMVASAPLPAMKNVRAIYPSNLLRRIAGRSGSRLLTFIGTALRERPDFIGGFHLLINGLLALLLAEALRRRSIYICGGGQREVRGGGFETENRLFRRLGYADAAVERRLLDAAKRFDLIVTMGESAKAYFLEHGTGGRVEVVPGGFDAGNAPQTDARTDYDLVLVGRLSAVKRVDRLIEAVAMLRSQGLNVRAAVVGDGPSRAELEDFARRRGVDDAIHFAGWQTDVHDWLRRSRVFVLTSDSEGLSQAMVQAMLCNLPVVVSDVGDLGDIVVHAENGFLIANLKPAAFAARTRTLLDDRALLRRMGRAAGRSASHLTVDNVAKHWTEIFRAMR